MAAEHGESATTSTLKAEARCLRRVFDDLVEMIRIEAGALALRREVTDLTDAVAAAVANLQAELVLHKPVLDVPPTLSLVEAAPRMLHHIFINLLGNAAKFAPAATPITIQARRVLNGLTLSVLDEEPRLPSGRDTTLFDRFARADGDDMSGGTGLGLAIVKGFTEAMDLSVAAGNRADGGAAFEITWPEASIRRSEK